MSKIISLTDILENKIVKEKELEFYYEQLKEIQRKISFLETDLNLTKKIINMIEQENVVQVDAKIPILSFDEENPEKGE